MTDKHLERASRWYVYTLVDPRSGEVFYVGKGSGSRIQQHEKDARNPETVCSKKINKIRDIHAQGLEVDKRHCAYFWDEQAAYDHETDLIEEIGLENLTNVLPGGQKAWERRQQERASRRTANKPLHLWLAERDSRMRHLYARFADWFKAGLHMGGRKLSITVSEPEYELTARISEVVYNDFLPSMWKRIVGDEKALEVFRDRLESYGVRLV